MIGEAFANAPELCELYIAEKEGNVTDYVACRCCSNPEPEQLCFYSCRGDGTVKEVADGV